MLLNVAFFFSTLVILSQNCIWSEQIRGLDVLVIDMENSDMKNMILNFLGCLFAIFDVEPLDDALSRVGYGCAIFLADPNENGYTNRFSEDVITGANLINTDLSVENQRTFRDPPNMLIVVTLTDNIDKMKILPATSSVNRIIIFDNENCAESFKENFPHVLCSPEPVVGNCSFDNRSDSYQRVTLGRPEIKRAHTICPEKYWQILKTENCSINLTETTITTTTTTTTTLPITITDYHYNASIIAINTIGIATIIAAIVAIVWTVYRHYKKLHLEKKKPITSLKESTLFLEESVATEPVKNLPLKSATDKMSQDGQKETSTKNSAKTFAKNYRPQR